MNSPDSFRYRLAALVMLAAIALIAVPAAAHAPADIQLSYDDAAQKLTVTITHAVDNPQNHYIKNVKVKVNDAVSIDKDYTSQPSGNSFTYTYSLPLDRGDTIRVTATCSQGPSLIKVMDITAPAQGSTGTVAPSGPLAATTSAPATVSTQKSAVSLLPIIGAAALLLLVKKK